MGLDKQNANGVNKDTPLSNKVGPSVGPGVEPKLGPEEEGGKVESKMICYFED